MFLKFNLFEFAKKIKKYCFLNKISSFKYIFMVPGSFYCYLRPLRIVMSFFSLLSCSTFYCPFPFISTYFYFFLLF